MPRLTKDQFVIKRHTEEMGYQVIFQENLWDTVSQENCLWAYKANIVTAPFQIAID